MHSDISAIIPAYNAQSFLRQTLDSLLAQTLPPKEIIVVDDGSTDETASIAEAMAREHGHIRLVRQPNAGGARARLRGMQTASHPLLYFIDADDVALPDALERLAKGFNASPQASLCYGSAQMIDATGEPISTPQNCPPGHGPTLSEQLWRNHITTTGCALIAQEHLPAQALDHALAIGQDQIMWAHLAAGAPFYHIGGAPVLQYRKHEMNTTLKQLENRTRYTDYVAHIFSDNTIQTQLTARELTRLKRRRMAAATSFIAKSALWQGSYGLASEHAASAVHYEPLNVKLWALWLCAKLHFMPKGLRSSLFR